MNLFERKNHLLNELRYGLPSKRMLEVVSIGALKFDGKTVIIKCRYEDRDLPRMLEQNPFVTYNDWTNSHNHHYKEILSKNVIFDRKLLSRRGLLALVELVELMNNDVIVTYSGSYYERGNI
jgi:hypothetical protein